MKQNFDMTMEQYFQSLVEQAGGEFIGLCDGQVCFRSGPTEETCKLYPFALRSPEDVRLALKAQREKQKESQWEFETSKPAS